MINKLINLLFDMFRQHSPVEMICLHFSDSFWKNSPDAFECADMSIPCWEVQKSTYKRVVYRLCTIGPISSSVWGSNKEKVNIVSFGSWSSSVGSRNPLLENFWDRFKIICYDCSDITTTTLELIQKSKEWEGRNKLFVICSLNYVAKTASHNSKRGIVCPVDGASFNVTTLTSPCLLIVWRYLKADKTFSDASE